MIRALVVVGFLFSSSLSLAQPIDISGPLVTQPTEPAPKIGGPLGVFVGSTVGTVAFALTFTVLALNDCFDDIDTDCGDDDAAVTGTFVATILSAAVAITGLVWFIVRKIQRNRWRRAHGQALTPPLTIRW